MNNRMLEFMKIKGLTSVKLAELLGVQASAISHITSGRNKPSFDFLVKLMSAFPDLNPDWFIKGNGGILRSYDKKNEIEVKKQNYNGELEFEEECAPEESAGINEISRKSYGKISGKSDVGIVRIVIFYDDNTFESYSI